MIKKLFLTFYAVRNAFLQANDFVSNAHGEG